MRKYIGNRRKRTKKTKKVTYTAAIRDGACFLLTFTVLLITVLSVRTCTRENGATPQPDITLTFNSVYKITVHNHETNTTHVVPLDEYIFHVVAAEMPASYDTEALKAQAVAARTYAFSKSASLFGDNANQCSPGHFDICTDSSCCQSWKSISQLKERWGKDYNLYAKKVYDAVLSTDDLIITYDNKPINAMYHASSGGHTMNAEDVYGGSPVPYLRSVESPGEESYSGYSDTVKFTHSEAAKLINENFGQRLTKNTVRDSFGVLSTDDNGYVYKVRVGDKRVTGRDIRHAFSLKSSNFTIKMTAKYVIIDVRGYGHGVGMSQSGAAAMAANGSRYDDILTHYYTGIQIKSIGSLL